MAGCQRGDLGGHSVARVWDEMLLSLIRQVVPAPTVHARNLFHVSAAMWDAWAAYDSTASGYFVTDKLRADDAAAAREAAISYAAYRILLWRYGTVADLAGAPDELDAVMASLCYRTDYAATEGDSPAALGNRIAAAILESGRTDGSLEEQRYVDMSHQPANPPLEVAEPGTVMRDPDRWQPLSLAKQIAQNGLPIPGKVQVFIGPHWGHVTSFALPASDAGTPIDPGPPPLLGDPATDAAFREGAVEVIRRSTELDATDGVTIDIGPGALGDSTLGTNDGDGREVNPATGAPYDAERRAPGRLHPGAGGVLGGRSGVGDAARPLERHRQYRQRRGRVRASDRGGGGRARPPRVGHQALLRAQRGRPRRGRRRVGPQGSLRLGPPDLDDPLPGWQGPVNGSVPAVLRRGRPAPRARGRRARHGRDRRSRRAPRAAGRPPRARSRFAPGSAAPRIPRRRRAGSAGCARSTGCPTSGRRS